MSYFYLVACLTLAVLHFCAMLGVCFTLDLHPSRTSPVPLCDFHYVLCMSFKKSRIGGDSSWLFKHDLKT